MKIKIASLDSRPEVVLTAETVGTVVRVTIAIGEQEQFLEISRGEFGTWCSLGQAMVKGD